VVVQGDSLIWGGFGDQPTILESFDSDIHDIQINYSLDYMELLGNTAYRYRLNGGNWTVWNTNPQAHFVNMASGIYTMEIQGRDSMGRLSETVTLEFTIRSPFYLRWFMQLLYFVLLGIIIYLLVRWRMHRLEQDKIRLESIVQERTAEVAKQKDELMRQEKMATVGKLTQGLIDRILNPMNYINNFSKLSSDLIKDVRANVKDEEEHMDEENYQDTMEVLDMLTQNLSKVEQHGMNTTRTLKAMEEMLKDRSGGMIPMNLVPMLQKNFEMLNQYFQNDIHAYGIHTTFDCAYDELQIRGNAEQLSKSIMSFLGNSIYAVVKQAERAADYHPEILLSVSVQSSDIVCIRIYDNGTGIEETIIDKIFDPFFTTKTTGEASGVGLYLSHEIVQNHGGDITVKSEKDKFTEFVITIPMLKH
jgi:signal transduction histidine kinase